MLFRSLLNYYTAEVTGRISDSSRVIWDSSVTGTRTVLLDQPVGVLDARIAMSDGGAAFNILELSWSGVAIPEPSSALFVLVGLDKAKEVIERVIVVTRIGLSRGDF